MTKPELSADLLEHKSLKLSILARIDIVKPKSYDFLSFEKKREVRDRFEYNRYICFSNICRDKRYKPAYAELNKTEIAEMLKAFSLFSDSTYKPNIPVKMSELIFEKQGVELRIVYNSGKKYLKLSLYSDSQVFDIEFDSEDVKIIKAGIIKGQRLGNAMTVELEHRHSY